MAFLESYDLQGTGVSEPDGTNLHVSSFFVLVFFEWHHVWDLEREPERWGRPSA